MARLVMNICSILMALPQSAKCRKLLLRPPMKLFFAKLLCSLINTMSRAFCLSILPATNRGIRQPQLIKWFSILAQSLFPPIFLPGLPIWEFGKQLLFKSIPNSTPSPSKHSLLLAIPILMRKSAFHGPFVGSSLLLLASLFMNRSMKQLLELPSDLPALRLKPAISRPLMSVSTSIRWITATMLLPAIAQLSSPQLYWPSMFQQLE